MSPTRSNIILIGMPGSGKSTVGVVLAKLTSMGFVDTDILIQRRERRSLQTIVDTEGHMVLRDIEEQVLLGLDIRHHVVATGGSAVYSEIGMAHLKSNGVVIYLQVDLTTLRSRVSDYDTRGLAKAPDQTLEDLFRERSDLYTTYADIIVGCDELTHDEVCAAIFDELKTRQFVLT